MNYSKIEIDFIERTIALIDQYEELKERFDFSEQYDHTLLTNCLLGLIVFPKERTISFIPKEKLIFIKTLQEWGVKKTTFNENIKDTRELFHRLRNAVAHFGIDFISDTHENKIDRIVFTDAEAGIFIANFYSNEILPFLKYFSSILIENLKKHG
jgi:hypothetical protein